MRTGSIGNRDAETLINTLVEPKKSTLGNLRKHLLEEGFGEEADYDAINIESYIAYSLSGQTRFIFKHKWNLSVTLLLKNGDEETMLKRKVPESASLEFSRNEDDGTIWSEMNPQLQTDLILKIVDYFVKTKEIQHSRIRK